MNHLIMFIYIYINMSTERPEQNQMRKMHILFIFHVNFTHTFCDLLGSTFFRLLYLFVCINKRLTRFRFHFLGRVEQFHLDRILGHFITYVPHGLCMIDLCIFRLRFDKCNTNRKLKIFN